MKKIKFYLNKNKENIVLYLLIVLSVVILSYPLISNKIKYKDDYYFHITNLLVNRDYIYPLKLKFIIHQMFSGGIANNLGYVLIHNHLWHS